MSNEKAVKVVINAGESISAPVYLPCTTDVISGFQFTKASNITQIRLRAAGTLGDGVIPIPLLTGVANIPYAANTSQSLMSNRSGLEPSELMGEIINFGVFQIETLNGAGNPEAVTSTLAIELMRW